MPDQLKVDAALKYLETYKDKFPKEALIKQLISSGYTQDEINAADSLITSNAVDESSTAEELLVDNTNIPENKNNVGVEGSVISNPVQSTVSSPAMPVQEPIENNKPIPSENQIMPEANSGGQVVTNMPPQMVGSDFNYGNQSSDKKKVIIYAIAGIVLIILGIVGYGFWNGSNIRNFAKKARDYNETVKDWEATFNPDFERVSKDSAEILEELKKGAPSKAKRLHTNLTEYFTHSKSLADSLKNVDEEDYYSADLEDLVKKEDIDFMENADKVKDEIVEDVEKLEKVNFSF